MPSEIEDRPTLYTIPSGVSFVDALAAGLTTHPGHDPLAFTETLVLVPTRRAGRGLTQAFLRQSRGQALLLPRIRPFGDVDEEDLSLEGVPEALSLKPSPSPLARRFLVARLILAWWRQKGISDDHGAALAHGDALIALLDEMATERIDWKKLDGLVPADLAHHWQDTLDFLKIAFEHWPAIMADRGWLDVAVRRDRLIGLLAERWKNTPPGHPVIVAGSTGSIPAAADLMAVAAGLPKGMIVLPGLDLSMDERAWTAVGQDHPQWGLKRLLDHLGITRAEVAPWPPGFPATPPPARTRLLSAALGPATVTDSWAEARTTLDLDQALNGLGQMEAPDAASEARAIALMLREALEEPERTAMLVTPDRVLARRVAADLRRWAVEVDDSAGTPLDRTVPGGFLRLVLDLGIAALAPLPLLAVLKHPLTGLGLDPALCRTNARRIEIAVLHGLRPPPGFTGLRKVVAEWAEKSEQTEKKERHFAFIDRIEWATNDLLALGRGQHNLATIVGAHVRAAETFAASATSSGADRLWQGDAGAAAAGLIADLIEATQVTDPEPLDLHGYRALFEAALRRIAVRPSWGRHPRLAILGPQEARLIQADLVILGGLNEGTWPAAPPDDPWLSRPMRQTLGLPQPERRIGQAAHDFATLAAAPEVVLTRALKVDNTPTVPSRWLQRLDALIGARTDWHLTAPLDWAGSLDTAIGAPRPEPRPRPPVALRPQSLFVSDVELLIRDPYALYAKRILKLRPLEPIDADPTVALRGTIIHDALERFLKADSNAPLAPDALDRLLAEGRHAFATITDRPALQALLWPRFEAIAHWFLTTERARRPESLPLALEVEGTREIEVPHFGPFTLKARADRIDRTDDGRLVIIDYKTGQPPKTREVIEGEKPQLTLEAAIAQAGGFQDVPAAKIARLEFWQITGGNPPGRISPVEDDAETLANTVIGDLARLISRYGDLSVPYLAKPHATLATWGDYDHLARIEEWAAEEETP